MKSFQSNVRNIFSTAQVLLDEIAVPLPGKYSVNILFTSLCSGADTSRAGVTGHSTLPTVRTVSRLTGTLGPPHLLTSVQDHIPPSESCIVASLLCSA